ncbi:MAG: hypothetical protein Kow0069_23520 [Promethearchaeota archaeon]
MTRHVMVPAFIFGPATSGETTTTVVKRKDSVLEIEFPVFGKENVLETAHKLALRKRMAHDRPIDELIDIMDQVGHLWGDPNYDLRKEALEVIPVISGQSRQLCEFELDSIVPLWTKPVMEALLSKDLGGKEFLEQWVPMPTGIRLHAQPLGLVYHSLAGNSFNLGMTSLFNGMLTKNVNLVKLAREAPYFTVRLAESIKEVDRKIAKELAVLYWRGQDSEIFDALFNSGDVDAVLAWGGLFSIQEIRRRAYQYGIKVIDYGPKLSFSIISEEALTNPDLMRELARKISMDVAIFNQKACLSPRVVFIKEKPGKSTVASNNGSNDRNGKAGQVGSVEMKTTTSSSSNSLGSVLSRSPVGDDDGEIRALMQRSVGFLRKEIMELSPLGFARILAQEMEKTEQLLPRMHQTQAEVVETIQKREYFAINHEALDNGKVFTPPDDSVNWTVVYLRNPPTMREINMCMNRFIIVTRVVDLDDVIYYMRQQKLGRFLQTFSIYGTDEFVQEVAEELSLLGAFRFPRVGEHNNHKLGSPMDGRFILREMVKWVNIDHTHVDAEEPSFSDFSHAKL